jgi:hypothetical protein
VSETPGRHADEKKAARKRLQFIIVTWIDDAQLQSRQLRYIHLSLLHRSQP